MNYAALPNITIQSLTGEQKADAQFFALNIFLYLCIVNLAEAN